jgi:hypothetical protein
MTHLKFRAETLSMAAFRKWIMAEIRGAAMGAKWPKAERLP